jgi:hypothetical protein
LQTACLFFVFEQIDIVTMKGSVPNPIGSEIDTAVGLPNSFPSHCSSQNHNNNLFCMLRLNKLFGILLGDKTNIFHCAFVGGFIQLVSASHYSLLSQNSVEFVVS